MKINFIENFWNVENINDDNVLNVTGITAYISSVCVTTLWLFLCKCMFSVPWSEKWSRGV